MKKIVLLLALFLLVFFDVGAQSKGFSGMSRLYSIVNSKVKDIRGDVNLSRILIAKDGAMSKWSALVSLDKVEQNNVIIHYITVEYTAINWAFIEELIIKIDDQFFTLKDDQPKRSTVRGGVTEIINFYFYNEEILSLLKKCNSLVIQFYSGPITIPTAGINAIKSFLE